MKNKSFFPILLALAVVAVLVACFPPGGFSWHRFFIDQAPFGRKLGFLLKAYALPACLSFTAVVLFQVQMRMSLGGAPVGVIFPLAVLGATSMLGAFRSMTGGIGGVPGYAVGMASAYTMMSRLYAVRPSGRMLFGKPMLRVVWRGDPEATREIQMSAARRQLQANASAPK
jgi:hypothetical protein